MLLYEGAVIQLITDLFDQSFEYDEIKHYSCPVQVAFDGNGDLIVVSMKGFSLAIGEDKKVRRGEAKVVFSYFDTEAARHDRTLSKSISSCKVSEKRVRGEREACP